MPKLTQAEIDALPRPIRMMRDLVLCQRLTEHKVGSIWLPEGTTPDIICRVLDVGPGLLLDGGFLRVPQVQRGDKILTTPADGHPLFFANETLWVYEWSTEVIGIFEDESITCFGNPTC